MATIYSVNLWATNENTPSDAFTLQYSTTSSTGPWNSCTPTVNNDTTCRSMSPTLNIPSGNTIYFRLIVTGSESIGGQPIEFGSALGSSCPAADTLCVVSYTINSITDIAFTALADSGTGNYTYCPLVTPNATSTQTPTPTITSSQTATPTVTQTPTITQTPTVTPTNPNIYDCSGCIGTGWIPYDATSCYKISTSAATAPVNAVPLVRRSAVEYSQLGTEFYDTGFSVGGTGTILQTSLTAPLWYNSPNNTINGPMNRCAIWYSAYTITNTWLGFSTCLTGISVTNTYYVGIAADNEFKLVLDGVTILDTTVGSMGAADKFKYWHVYPVTIPSGNHTLELYGLDYGVIAGFGMEIYDNTLSELTGATTLGDLNIIFSSSGYTYADLVQTTGGVYLSSGYTCPSGYVYSSCSGNCIDYQYCYSTPVTPTPTNTETPTQTPTNSQTPTQTQTPTNSQTQTQTPTNSQTPTQTQTPTNTQTPTQTQTPTNTQTPTQTNTQTPGLTIQFQDCSNGDKFRYYNGALPTIIGDTYNITGGNDFNGCATIITNTSEGPLYDATGVIFTMTTGCGDPVCPRTSEKPASLSNCATGEVIYLNVDSDTAYPGAVYLYSGGCYSFVEFSGPGGEYVPGPSYSNCIDCIPVPLTPTPYPSPTQTPTVSSTPQACSSTYCFNTTDSSLSGYSGNYTYTGSYNGSSTFIGDGILTGYIYYNNNSWCLSTSIGGSCLLQGASPCYYNCPDFSSNVFYSGPCVTPTPTPINCDTFDFNAYFDCDWEPVPTPSPSVACDDVNFDISSIGVTPTPSPSQNCSGKAVSFSLSGYTVQPTPTPSNTPTVTITRTVDVAGSASYVILDETFSCVSVKVLIDCSTGDEVYVTSSLILNGTPATIGTILLVDLDDGTRRCVIYDRDDSNISSNVNVDTVLELYNDCAFCNVVPTPTPTTTPTPTQTSALTPTLTNTSTPTPTITQSPSSTNGTTPPATPTPTKTPTTTMTPTTSQTPTYTQTPTPTSTFVHVYQSCSAVQIGKFSTLTQVVQTVQVPFVTIANNVFKDSYGNCWTYLGRFDSSYIVPSPYYWINYSGNYFDGAPSIVYGTCTDCETNVIYKVSITGKNLIDPTSDGFKIQYSTVSSSGPWNNLLPYVNKGTVCKRYYLAAVPPQPAGSYDVMVPAGSFIYFQLLGQEVPPIKFYSQNGPYQSGPTYTCDSIVGNPYECSATWQINNSQNITIVAYVYDDGTGQYVYDYGCP